MKKYLFPFLLFVVLLQLPVFAQDYKALGTKLMGEGKFGEAIDAFSKFITLNAQNPEGYNLRGQCFEKRNQLMEAVYDFRFAVRLQPSNKGYNDNLNRAQNKWFDELKNRIKGFQREIAINPNKPKNYLEIGICYRHLGEWIKAEEWYDKYLAMEEASPDEVIRYTEILAQNKHLEKGEIILKRYVDKYPNDHRLWSRYGYFSYWLGKNQQAKFAFETTLKLRPFFREAMEGLDLVIGKEFIYTFGDTTQYKESQKQQIEQEFAIDKYYRILKANPKDVNTRYLLIEELLKAERYEEALQQVQILGTYQSGEPKYEAVFEKVKTSREAFYLKKIDEYKILNEKSPDDKKVIKELVRLYSNMSMYDEALAVLDAYFERHPEDDDCDLKFDYAQVSSNDQSYYTAVEYLDPCIEKNPGNLEAKMLRALIAVWLDEESNLPMAEEYLNENIKAKPNNVIPLIGLASLKIKIKQFDEARNLIEQIKKIDPNVPEIQVLSSNLETGILRAKEEELFASLEVGREKFREGDCTGAIEVYDTFYGQHEGNRTINKEYADILGCAKEYDRAIEQYDKLLAEGYDPLIDLDRAKTFFYKEDYQTALIELNRLYAENNVDFSAALFRGDCYAQIGEYDMAEEIYDSLLAAETDSVKIQFIVQRQGWLPKTGIDAIFENFPLYSLVNPSASYFADNLDFSYVNYSIGVEFGVLDFLSVGASGFKGDLKSAYTTQLFNGSKFSVFLRPYGPVTVGGSYGTMSFFSPAVDQPMYDAFIRIGNLDTSMYYVQGSYFKQDAATILYSPNLVAGFGTNQRRFTTELYKFEGFYKTNTKFRISLNYTFLVIEDGNKGANLELRLGRYFLPELLAGYEYYTSVFARKSNLYFSPTDYSSHSVFADWNFFKDESFDFRTGGRFGIISQNNYWLREVYALFSYAPVKTLRLQLRGQLGNTVKDITGYSSRALNFTMFWTF